MYRNRHTPGGASGRGARSQLRKAEPSGIAGTPGGMFGAPGGRFGRGGTAAASAGVLPASCGPAGRGTGFMWVPCVSRVPSLSIALSP
ncbi:hypothetical protein AB0D59_31035 [Streptomyces sp. NPDC048417]|uniref:hypothetical protein n=1 Tax=Streptomyces sp. NPDC048417 TaxID=3155387 RepID=UPI003449CF9F